MLKIRDKREEKGKRDQRFQVKDRKDFE